ncbi:MAG TPA: riboflavin synthase [Candidatus Ornithomonoglobus merdipullorum]|uniref:Riboflavin synthase n=1 Tax=Candidatus Ornithomonoglobus merdipullorum TaxID=2840895 RepID=A0A9D1MA00_9FIRM|nr:riboflavin synthase [Candidatus Ornithomonoglobus merdipullorum]
MFTGIIEETGTVEAIVRGAKSCRLTIRADKIFDDLSLGDSVAVNGVCLTADEIRKPVFVADVMAETVRRTNIDRLVPGSRVNLERAMRLGGRFGGHIVAGHIDGTGTIVSMVREDNAVWVTVTAGSEMLRYIIEKGSVALDGISLTVAEVGTDRFSVSVIPHTAAETTLLSRRTGDRLNIECDMIGKYVEKFVSGESRGITPELLAKYGF